MCIRDRWRDDWHVDFSKEVGKEIDAAGWEYAVEFGGFGLVTKSRTRRFVHLVRWLLGWGWFGLFTLIA